MNQTIYDYLENYKSNISNLRLKDVQYKEEQAIACMGDETTFLASLTTKCQFIVKTITKKRFFMGL